MKNYRVNDCPNVVSVQMIDVEEALIKLSLDEELDNDEKVLLKETADLFGQIDSRSQYYSNPKYRNAVSSEIRCVATSLRTLFFDWTLSKLEKGLDLDPDLTKSIYETFSTQKMNMSEAQFSQTIDLLNYISRDKYLEACYGKPKYLGISA